MRANLVIVADSMAPVWAKIDCFNYSNYMPYMFQHRVSYDDAALIAALITFSAIQPPRVVPDSNMPITSAHNQSLMIPDIRIRRTIPLNASEARQLNMDSHNTLRAFTAVSPSQVLDDLCLSFAA